jgi:hypothetical protein
MTVITRIETSGTSSSSGVEHDNQETDVGRGISSRSGEVPETDGEPGIGDPVHRSVVSSLSTMSGRSGNQDTDIALIEVAQTLESLIDEVHRDRIAIDQEKQRTIIERKVEKLEKAAEKLRKALNKEDSGAWATIKSVFSIIGAVMTIGVGIALCLTGGAALLGGMMIAMGVLQLIMAADGIATEETGMGIAGNFARMSGASKEKAQEADMAFRISVAVAMALLAIACIAAPGAQTGTTLLQVQKLAQFAQNATTIGLAVGETYGAARQFKASDIRRDETDLRSDALEIEAALKVIQDTIEALLAYLKGSLTSSSEMIGSITEAASDTARTLIRAKLTA